MEKLIEVSGVKLEVDLREAKTIESFKVGDNVKVLTEKYNNEFEVNPGVIVGFEQFENLPTIVIAYIDGEYNPDLKFIYLNNQSKKTEIVHANKEDMSFEKSEIIEKLNKKIEEKKLEIKDLESKMAYFLKYFNKYFSEKTP